MKNLIEQVATKWVKEYNKANHERATIVTPFNFGHLGIMTPKQLTHKFYTLIKNQEIDNINKMIAYSTPHMKNITKKRKIK